MLRPLALALVASLLIGCAPSDSPGVSPAPAVSGGTPPGSAVARADAAADSSWTTGPTEVGGAETLARLVGVRWASHPAEGFDRVVFEFEGPLPGARVASPDGPPRRCGSGEPVTMSSASVWEVRLQPAAAHDEAGQATAPHERARADLPAVHELVPTCDFEGDVTWALGVAEGAPYRVLRLSDPGRLVVDVRHPD